MNLLASVLTTNMALKRTPLLAAHQRLGARLVEFGGWEMPVQYSSIVEEHLTVRNAAGIFDISHMGEVQVGGPCAERFLNRVLTNDVRRLAVGQAQYSLMCNERGGVVDDLYVYRVDEEDYLLIINASRIEADWDWLQAQFDKMPLGEAFRLRNASESFGAVAVQGPRVKEFVNTAVSGGSIKGTLVGQVTDLQKNQVAAFVLEGISIFVARTGYTGEDGFEVVAPAESIEVIWNRLLSVGQSYGLKPAGLGARDTLRTEMGYPLYGHELDEHTTPIEAGLGFFVALDKDDFVGRDVLASQKTLGVLKKCVAFKMTGKSAPPRPGYVIGSSPPNPAPIGKVVSGTQSPTLGVGIGLGYVQPEFAKAGTAIEIEIRGQRAPAMIVPKPIYRKAA